MDFLIFSLILFAGLALGTLTFLSIEGSKNNG